MNKLEKPRWALKAEIRDKAQDRLMDALGVAFSRLYDEEPEHMEEIKEAMDAQMKRIERLFGYDPGSWARGC